MIELLNNIETPNNSTTLEGLEDSEKLQGYFSSLDNPEIDDFDSLSIPVLSFMLKDVTTLEKGVYSSSEEKEEIVTERNKPVYRAIKTEFFKFICTDDKTYKAERKKITGEFDKAAEIISSAISAAIATATLGPMAGVAIGVIAALVTVMLKIAIKIGIKTWCGTLA